MKKVLLVNCNTEKAPYPVPPLGLCLLAASLEGTWEVSIYDCMFDEGAGLVDRVLQFNPDYIGFSIRNIDNTTPDSVYYVDDQISGIIRPVQDISPAVIILGGSGFSIFPEELMQLTQADYGIIGEAESTLHHLLALLDKGEEVFPSLVVLVGNSKIRGNTRGSYHKGLFSGRFSEIDLKIDFSPYRERGAYSVQSKRGCSHGCIYCTYPLLEGTIFRTRKPSDIVEEIEQAFDRVGDVMFEFVDSTFNDPKGHAEEICREIIRRKLRVRLRTMGINPRNSNESLFELMMEAGFVQIDATPDTASARLLANLGKGFDLPEVQQMATTIKKFNLPTMWFFLFGSPGENEDTFNETLDFIDTYINPEDLVYMASGLRVYPNTPLEKTALQEKLIKPGQSLLYPPVFYFSDGISRERLSVLIKEASSERMNCIYSTETRPPAEMMLEAHKLRAEKQIREPMFRTLLRIRKEWKEKGLV
ncbi:MAG: radical SAM protein [Bacteroidetes bacterium]|nr:radical SAM protein [Bacteroidota bacterium]